MAFAFVNSPRVQLAYNIFCWANFAALLLVVVLILHRAPAPQVPRDAAAASRVEQKFSEAEQATAAGAVSPQVHLDATELNSYLTESLGLADRDGPSSTAAGQSATPEVVAPRESAPAFAGEPVSANQAESDVRDVKINLEGDLLKAYVVFNIHGEDLSLKLDGHLSSENGYLRFDPVSGEIGSLPLPQSALDMAVHQVMNSPENRDKLRLPDQISAISIQNGEVVICYK